MFSSTGYEAFYTYIGLYLHEASIKIITSQEVLLGILMLIFSMLFIFTLWRYFKRYLPRFMAVRERRSTLSLLFKIVLCFILGVSLLKIETPSDVKNFKRISWSENQYIKTRMPDVRQNYKVSFIFDLLSRSAEELAYLASIIVDKLFAKTHSHLEAPDAFYKAVLYAGSQNIEDPDLRALLGLYTEECFPKVLPLVGEMIEKRKKRHKMLPRTDAMENRNRINEFFKKESFIDKDLKLLSINSENGENITCLDLKYNILSQLRDLARKKNKYVMPYRPYFKNTKAGRVFMEQENFLISSVLTNYYLNQSSTFWLGVQKGAKVPGFMTSFLMGLKRLFSFDGVLHLSGLTKLEGANLTADRANKFSEYLKRAPHLKGLVKLFLIALFPYLVFFIFAGKWKIIISWWAVYLSVLLWTPIWTLLYHLMTTIAHSAEFMHHFGQLSQDGISLYSANFISTRLYQFYAIYSWLQIILGPLPTIFLAWGMFTGFLKDSEAEDAPDGIGTVASVAGGVATGGAAGGAKAATKEAASGVGYRSYK